MDDQLQLSTLAGLTTEIVAAFVANHTVANSDLPRLIDLVSQNLNTLGTASEVEDEKPNPAVSIKRSVRNDHLVCLICGRSMKVLKRHLSTKHDLSESGYRQLFGLPANYPLTAPGYSKRRSKLAKDAGLGLKKKPVEKAKRSPKRGKRTGARSQ